MKVINNHTQPLPLDSGVILAAAGTEGSTAVVEKLTDRDRRKASKGLFAIVDDAAPPAPALPAPAPPVEAEAEATNERRRGK